MKIMNLWEYTGKHVKIIDIDGKVYNGLVDFYTSELDEPDGVATISLRPDNSVGILIDFTEGEITEIEIMSANTPAMANAV